MIKKLTKPIILKYENKEFYLPDDVKENIKKYWNGLVSKNPKLFNGENHCVQSVVENDDNIQMTVVRTNYSTYLYNDNIGMPDQKYNIIHIWSGILLETLDGYLVVGEMDETTSVPKCLQVPGGGTSDEDIKGDILDITLNLKRELKEELNLDLDKIDYEIKYLECPTKGRSVYGFLAYGKVNMTKNELNNYFEGYKKYLEKNDLEIEFSKLVFLNKEDGVSELDKLENPKREYLRELIEICSKIKD